MGTWAQNWALSSERGGHARSHPALDYLRGIGVFPFRKWNGVMGLVGGRCLTKGHPYSGGPVCVTWKPALPSAHPPLLLPRAPSAFFCFRFFPPFRPSTADWLCPSPAPRFSRLLGGGRGRGRGHNGRWAARRWLAARGSPGPASVLPGVSRPPRPLPFEARTRRRFCYARAAPKQGPWWSKAGILRRRSRDDIRRKGFPPTRE